MAHIHVRKRYQTCWEAVLCIEDRVIILHDENGEVLFYDLNSAEALATWYAMRLNLTFLVD